MFMKKLHFELDTLSLKSNGPLTPLTLHLNSKTFQLQPHSSETLLQAAQANPAIALIPAEQRYRLTHFAEIPRDCFPEDGLVFIQVTSPDEDPEIYLPKLYHVSFYVPHVYRERRLKRVLATSSQHLHPKLYGFGVMDNILKGVKANEMENIYLEADDLLTPWDIAKSILFYHPELASNKPQTAAIVIDEHIAPSPDLNPEQYNKVYNLAISISKQGVASSSGGWARITDSVDKNGTPLRYQYDLGTHKTGDRVLIYKLSDETSEACVSPLVGAMRSSNDDPRLKDQVWKVNQGITAEEKDKESNLQKSLLMAKEAGPDIWRVNDKTPSHGLNVYNDSITFNDSNTFSIAVKNIFLRTLCAYVQFYRENGEIIKNPAGWKENLPSHLRFLETDSKKYISSVSAVNSIIGIPMPTDPTTLEFPFPRDAASLKLMFGCLGTSKWDADVDVSGALLTGFFQYGIPVFFMAAGAAVTSTKFYNDLVKDQKLMAILLEVVVPIIGQGVVTATALTNTKEILFGFADAVAGILVQKGLEQLALYITGTLTVQQLETQIPFVGWALKLANIAIDIAQMAVTTGELLSSPATLEVEVKRVMDLHLTLKPDKNHGEIGDSRTAVWPAISDYYHVTVVYQGGTNFVLKGKMPGVTSGQPLKLTFPELPIGGKFQIIAGIYAKNGWLCGKVKSNWYEAFPAKGTKIKEIEESIEEQLVPLTQDSQYLYKEKMLYDANLGKHKWQNSDIPLATTADLHCDLGFKTICKPVNMTINLGASQIGYVWRSAGAKFVCQNISILEDPQSRYKFSEVGFDVQPYIAYDEFGTKSSAGPETNKAISEDNFLLDTRNGQFHLRQVNLTDGKSGFGLTDPDLKSWGKFNMSNIDAIVFHPNRVVVGVSWNDHKMEILELPEEPVADDFAPDAQMVSGMGVRQGLLKGPKLISVTPDGRILILETLNRRVQAFDTKGNPVASFMGEHLLTLDAAQYVPELDAGIFSAALQQEFQKNGLTHIFNLCATLQADLDQAKLSDAVLNAFADEGIYLTYDKDNRTNPKVSSYVTVQKAGSAWTVTDPNKKIVYSIEKKGADLEVFDVLNNVSVDVRSSGKNWVIQDWNGAQSYYIAVDENDTKLLRMNRYLSYMSLYNPDGRTDIEYLDMAVEARGYIYILSYTRPGNKISDYRLDIYLPDGNFLVRTPDSRLQPKDPQYISAARMVVDLWRNVYTMNFEAIQGPDSIIEPSISHWIPTPPLFTLALEEQNAFINGDMGMIRQIFAKNRKILSKNATVKTININGYWQVIDTAMVYDVIRSGKNLEVYLVPGDGKADLNVQ